MEATETVTMTDANAVANENAMMVATLYMALHDGCRHS
jgi:hypothetical protein